MPICFYCKQEIPDHEGVRIQFEDQIVWVCLICEDENYESLHDTDERGE